jgi:hypothetical protein
MKMKTQKIILLLAMILIFKSTSLFAADFDWGVKGGVNIYNIHGKDVSQYLDSIELKMQSMERYNTVLQSYDIERKTDFLIAAGGFVTFNLTNLIKVQPELLFSSKGFAMKWNEWDDFDDKEYWHLFYLETPLLLKVIIPTDRLPFIPNVFIGPTLGILLEDAYRDGGAIQDALEDAGYSNHGDISDDFDLDFNRLDYGLVFGAGIDFKKSNFLIDVRYTLGLRTIDGSSNPYDIKNGVFSIMIGHFWRRKSTSD